MDLEIIRLYSLSFLEDVKTKPSYVHDLNMVLRQMSSADVRKVALKLIELKEEKNDGSEP